jgi:hypothetical protein
MISFNPTSSVTSSKARLIQRFLSQVAYGRADTQGNTGDFVSRQRHRKGKAKEDQQRQLNQTGAAPRKRREEVGHQ